MSTITSITASYRAKLITQAFSKWITKGERALDIGCGNGHIASHLRNTFSLHIIGCDVKNYLAVNVPFKLIKNGNLPSSTKKYEVAFLIDVLHHLDYDNQFELINKAMKISKKLLIFEVRPTMMGKLFDIVLNKYHYGDLHVPLAFRDPVSWQYLFKKHGYISTFQPVPKPIWYPFSHIAFLVERKHV
jgi:SAM-dependent methyltransferase